MTIYTYIDINEMFIDNILDFLSDFFYKIIIIIHSFIYFNHLYVCSIIRPVCFVIRSI